MHRGIGNHGAGRLAAGVLLLGVVGCKEPNPAFDGPGAGSSSTGASLDTSTGVVPPITTTGSTTSGVDGTSSTSLDPDTSTGPVLPESSSGGSTDATTSTTSGSTTSGGSSSDSGGEMPTYPPCMLGMDPVCPRPYDNCYESLAPEYTACSVTCMDDADCPLPTTGDAVPVCAGQMDDQCVLDCADAAVCPDGMECRDVAGGMFLRCLWPA